MIIRCMICKEDGKEFKVPYDKIGIAVMEEHVKEEHEFKTYAIENYRKAMNKIEEFKDYGRE